MGVEEAVLTCIRLAQFLTYNEKKTWTSQLHQAKRLKWGMSFLRLYVR